MGYDRRRIERPTLKMGYISFSKNDKAGTCDNLSQRNYSGILMNLILNYFKRKQRNNVKESPKRGEGKDLRNEIGLGFLPEFPVLEKEPSKKKRKRSDIESEDGSEEHEKALERLGK